ncbi:MAG: transcriptional repressor LexA [Olsenella sp.]|nr:transcriptional repressor LexA [Olsenella sp.]
MFKSELTKRQKEIYEFICTYTNEHGYPPSVREIGKAVGLASPSTVHMHLKALQERGYIKRDSKKPRTIEVTDDGQSPTDAKLAEVKQNSDDGTVSLPLVGRVAAGTPILAEQNVEETFKLPISIVGDASSFVLKVRGRSMINAGIFDGDYVVVKEQSDARDGEIVVALIDDSATVKTFYREDGRIRLQPENDAMSPIYADNPLILGKVTGLFRSIS